MPPVRFQCDFYDSYAVAPLPTSHLKARRPAFILAAARRHQRGSHSLDDPQSITEADGFGAGRVPVRLRHPGHRRRPLQPLLRRRGLLRPRHQPRLEGGRRAGGDDRPLRRAGGGGSLRRLEVHARRARHAERRHRKQDSTARGGEGLPADRGDGRAPLPPQLGGEPRGAGADGVAGRGEPPGGRRRRHRLRLLGPAAVRQGRRAGRAAPHLPPLRAFPHAPPDASPPRHVKRASTTPSFSTP